MLAVKNSVTNIHNTHVNQHQDKARLDGEGGKSPSASGKKEAGAAQSIWQEKTEKKVRFNIDHEQAKPTREGQTKTYYRFSPPDDYMPIGTKFKDDSGKIIKVTKDNQQLFPLETHISTRSMSPRSMSPISNNRNVGRPLPALPKDISAKDLSKTPDISKDVTTGTADKAPGRGSTISRLVTAFKNGIESIRNFLFNNRIEAVNTTQTTATTPNMSVEGKSAILKDLLIQSNFQDEEGVFRLAGKTANVDQLVKMDLSKLTKDEYCVDDLATAFKRNFASGLTDSDCKLFAKMATDFEASKNSEAPKLPKNNELPKLFQDVLEASFLVVKNQGNNKMGASNLALLFCSSDTLINVSEIIAQNPALKLDPTALVSTLNKEVFPMQKLFEALVERGPQSQKTVDEYGQDEELFTTHEELMGDLGFDEYDGDYQKNNGLLRTAVSEGEGLKVEKEPIYATVNKTDKHTYQNTRFTTETDEDFYPDQNNPPEVPEKKF